jgi:hypothetical protein
MTGRAPGLRSNGARIVFGGIADGCGGVSMGDSRLGFAWAVVGDEGLGNTGRRNVSSVYSGADPIETRVLLGAVKSTDFASGGVTRNMVRPSDSIWYHSAESEAC